MAYSVIDIAKKIVCKTDVEHGLWKHHKIGEEITNEELRSFFLPQIRDEKDGSEPFLTDEFGRIMLTDTMKGSLQKAEESLAEGTCMTEEKFQARFAQWI